MATQAVRMMLRYEIRVDPVGGAAVVTYDARLDLNGRAVVITGATPSADADSRRPHRFAATVRDDAGLPASGKGGTAPA